ncbi:MAG: hypothetical protein PVJ67_00660 [Candidatus Pacearchaeota archaeon]|jgi:hypothetical protein
MRPIKRADGVIFASDRIEESFNSLPENDWLKKAIKKAIENLKENVFCGERIRKELIPKEYIQKYEIDNLFWYKLPKAWRLVYSVAGDKHETLAIIIEYFNHKNYERRFGY